MASRYGTVRKVLSSFLAATRSGVTVHSILIAENEPRTEFGKNDVGNPVTNKILLALPENECDVLFSRLEFLPLPRASVLAEKDAPIKYGYFLNEGLASILNIMKTRKSIEVGLCGNEGFVGLPLSVGFTTSPAQVVMQIAGSGFRISAADLPLTLPRCPRLAIALSRFS